MNGDAVGASGELLAAIGVIVPLRYLAAQIRHDTRSVRASTLQDFTRERADPTRLMLPEKDLPADVQPMHGFLASPLRSLASSASPRRTIPPGPPARIGCRSAQEPWDSASR